jgi:endonuclease G
MRVKHAALAVLALWLSSGAVAAEGSQDGLHELKYNGFTIWHNCETKTPHMFYFELGEDKGNEPRHNAFNIDPTYPKECQQSSLASYRERYKRISYDRGHLVGANAMDNDELTMLDTFYITNIVPQSAVLNRGAWLRTEQIQECLRDLSPIGVLGGVIYSNEANDIYRFTHDIPTPDFFWKVIASPVVGTFAWVFPNNNEPEAAKIDKYLVTIKELEAKVGQKIPVNTDKNKVHLSSPLVSSRCNLS